MLTPFLSLAVTAAMAIPAAANVLVETALDRREDAPSPWTLGLDLGAGVMRGGRKHDVVDRYHLVIGVPIGYRSVYVRPILEVQYLTIETSRSSGQLRKASLTPVLDLEDGRTLRNIAVGLTVGGVIPSQWLRRFRLVQFGAFVEGRTTILRPALRFDELRVVYLDEERDVKSMGNANTTVHYRLWTITAASFATLRLSEIGWAATRWMRRRLIFRPVADSAVSVAVGATQFVLDVDVEVNSTLDRYVSDDPSERVTKRKPITLLRYAIPLTSRVGIEFLGAASQASDRWLYALDGMIGVRF
ncbi:hypothetical protein HY634_04050 [Candidatus Uhrbacteria bacterium]|nr:hypothetical protein [Candidatus Uhrbacteria bacterium]